MNIEVLVSELESAVRGNRHNFDNMFAAVNAIFHRDLDGQDPTNQNRYIHWFMSHFGSRKLWFFRIPSSRRVQLMSALVIGRKFRGRSESLDKLIEAGEAVLNNDIGTFKVCFRINC